MKTERDEGLAYGAPLICDRDKPLSWPGLYRIRYTVVNGETWRFSRFLHGQVAFSMLPWLPMAAGRRHDETSLQDVTILKSDNARMKRMCEHVFRRSSIKELASKLIHYGVEHIDDVESWYGLQAKEIGALQPGDELAD